MWRRSTTIWASMSLPTGWSKIWRSAPTVMVTLPPWTVTVPIASSSEVTACHSMLWLTGCSKIWRSVFRWRLSRCGDSGEDDIVLPSGSTLPGHVLVVGGGRGPVRRPGAAERAVRLGARAGRLPGSGSGRRGHADLVRAVLGDDRHRHRRGRARHHRQRPDRPPTGRHPRLRDPGHPGRAAH